MIETDQPQFDVFADRREELCRLHETLDGVRSGRRAVIVWVTGGPNSGKGRLMAEFTRKAKESLPRTVLGEVRCLRDDTSRPWQMLLRQMYRFVDGSADDSGAVAPWVSGQLTAEYTKGLRYARGAGNEAIVLALDDVHRPESRSFIGLLEEAAEAIADHPVVLVLVGQLRDPSHPLVRVKRELIEHQRAIEIGLDDALGSIARKCDFVRQYLEAAFGSSDIDQRLVEAIAENFAANPALCKAASRECHRRGVIGHVGGRVELERPIPDDIATSLQGVIEARWSTLTRDDQAILKIAGLDGATFTAEVVAEVRGKSLAEVVDRLNRELGPHGDGWIRPTGTVRAGVRNLSGYAFDIRAFHGFVKGKIQGGEKHWFCDVASAKAKLWGEDKRDIADELAAYFLVGGDLESASNYYSMAAGWIPKDDARQISIAIDQIKVAQIRQDHDEIFRAAGKAASVVVELGRGDEYPEILAFYGLLLCERARPSEAVPYLSGASARYALADDVPRRWLVGHAVALAASGDVARAEVVLDRRNAIIEKARRDEQDDRDDAWARQCLSGCLSGPISEGVEWALRIQDRFATAEPESGAIE